MIKLEDLAAGEKSRIDVEKGILDSRGNQDDIALLYIRQQRVLLEFVEPVDLIKKQYGPNTLGLSVLCRLYHLSQIIKAGCGGVKPFETGLRSCSYHLCKCCLACARRPIKDQR